MLQTTKAEIMIHAIQTRQGVVFHKTEDIVYQFTQY